MRWPSLFKTVNPVVPCTPGIMRSTVNLPGVAVVTALMIGGELAGVLGAIVAVPTAALLATVLGEYLQKDAPAN